MTNFLGLLQDVDINSLADGDALVFEASTKRFRPSSQKALNTAGAISTGDQTVTGNETVSGTLGVTGTLTALARGGNVTEAGNVTFSNPLLVPQGGLKADGATLAELIWVDVAVTAALLDGAGNVAVVAGAAGKQYKVRNIRLVGGGVSFGAGGDRLISLTDGTTVYTTIANADVEAAPAATLDWGNAKVPFLTGVSNTKTVANQALRFQYSGGTTDHGGVGSITFSVCLEKTN